ncbi:MAG: glycosyl hydrolase [Bacteroidetes bacterium OLB12]|nr:MAG: glycosyl hydrolase [Bacteroidetes bacterium OLB12]HNU41670.1 sialidase family protein [Cyclobacteriaceae bacterium]
MKQVKTLLILLSFIFIMAFGTKAQQDAVPVFTSGEDGYKSYRIPAIIRLPNSHLLAFCEGRVHDSNDFGNIDIVMKRSSDNGKTWNSIQVLADYDLLQAGNPAPVFDNSDPAYPNGRVFLFYNTGNNHEGEVRKGKGLREVWYITSVDGGITWSVPVNITTAVHRPNQPQSNAAYNFEEDWRCYANTPGHAMQFQHGRYKGRIYVAANRSAGEPQAQAMDYQAFGFYTDDHGKTFHISEIVTTPGSNESTAAELSNDRLMMNSRNQRNDIKARIVSVSNDGGATWDTTYFDKTLIDPINEGSILTLEHKKKHNVLAFCNAADVSKRNNLTLRISYDDGKTWSKSVVVDKSSEVKEYTAYSDLVKVSKKEIGVFYERDNYKEIVYSVVKWK